MHSQQCLNHHCLFVMNDIHKGFTTKSTSLAKQIIQHCDIMSSQHMWKWLIDNFPTQSIKSDQKVKSKGKKLEFLKMKRKKMWEINFHYKMLTYTPYGLRRVFGLHFYFKMLDPGVWCKGWNWLWLKPHTQFPHIGSCCQLCISLICQMLNKKNISGNTLGGCWINK